MPYSASVQEYIGRSVRGRVLVTGNTFAARVGGLRTLFDVTAVDAAPGALPCEAGRVAAGTRFVFLPAGGSPRTTGGSDGNPLPPTPALRVGGLEVERAALTKVVNNAVFRAKVFSDHGMRPPKSVLLHGPPGTGKTLLAAAVAAETGCALFPINAGEIVSAFYGESEAALREAFGAAIAAPPAVIFIDEIDAIAPDRSAGEVCECGRESW